MFNNLNIDNSSDFIYKDYEPEKFDYHSFYRAFVCSTEDPMHLGRVRVRIPALHGVVGISPRAVEDFNLPWASPGILINAGNDTGSYLTPPKGSLVFVTFEYGQQNRPIYFGGIPTKMGDIPKKYNFGNNVFNGEDVSIEDDDLIKDYVRQGAQVVYKSAKGGTILIRDNDGQECLTLIDPAGQIIEMANNGESLERRGDSLNPVDTSYISIRRGNSENSEEIKLEKGRISFKADRVDLPASVGQVIYDDDVMLR